MSLKSRKLDAFLDKVSYWFILDQDFQSIVYASGITLDKFKGQNYGAETVQTYLAALKLTGNHEYAKEQCSIFTTATARNNTQLRSPQNYEVLGAEFRALLSEECYLLLSETLKDAPHNGKAILEGFSLDTPEFLKGGVADEILDFYGQKFAFERDQKIDVRIIRDYPLLSKMIGGFNSGRLTILSAASGFGKTNLGLSLAVSAQKDYGVAYMNMEMGYDDIFKRLQVIISNCKYDDLHDQIKCSIEMMKLKRDETLVGNLFITDGKTLNIKQIFGAVLARNLKVENKIKILIIDYDQRLGRIEEGDEDQEWRYLLKDAVAMEDFGKEHDMHIILMCQLNRQGQIAASQRMINIAHTWLDFYKDINLGSVIHGRKNRHGETDKVITVKYDSALVKELLCQKIKEVIN